MLIIRGVNPFPTQIEELILEDQRLTPHYLLEVSRAGRLDQLKVIVEARPEAADPGIRTAAGAELDPTHQVPDRGHDRGRRDRTGPGRPLARQSQANHRP